MKVTLEISDASLACVRDIVANARWIIVALVGFVQLAGPVVSALLQ